MFLIFVGSLKETHETYILSVGREHPTVFHLSKHRSDTNVVFTAHTEISREILCFFDRASEYRFISITNLMHKFFYSITICMLHYNPRNVSSIKMPIFRRTNCIITASGIVTLCKRLNSMSDESRLCRVCSHPAYCTVLYRK